MIPRNRRRLTYPTFEQAIRFSLWAATARDLSPHRVASEWSLSRSTAYRWLRALHDARGDCASRAAQRPYTETD